MADVATLQAAEKLVATTECMARILGVGRSWLETLARDKWIKPLGKNQWNVAATVQGILKYKGDDRSRAVKTTVKSRVQEARVKEIEMRIAERSHIVIELEEGYALIDDVFGNLRADLGGLPAMFTRDLRTRSQIEKALNDILNRTAHRLQLRAKVLRETGETPTRPISIDSGRMGIEEQDLS